MDIKCQIKLNHTSDVEEFVKSASKCNFDIDVFYNRIVIDAKSILGVLSLDLSNILTVQYSERDPYFETTLTKFCVT